MKKKFVIRFILYILGLFLLSFGIALSIKSNTGVSPVSSVPLVYSQITGLTMGTVTFIVYLGFIALQIIILRKDFKAKDLLQIAFSSVFGLFVDLSLFLLRNLVPPNYLGQLATMASSLIVMPIGVFLLIVTDIVVNAPEGICLAICKRWNLEFSKVKVSFDIILVTISAISAMIFLGNLSQLREGTVVAAIWIGKGVGILQRRFSDKVKKLFTEDEAPFTGDVKTVSNNDDNE